MKRSLTLGFLWIVMISNKVYSQNHSDSVYKSLNLIKLGKALISIDPSIDNADQWKEFLYEDKSFVEKLCSSCNDSLFIYISKIEQLDSVSYRFKLLKRPLHSEIPTIRSRCSYEIYLGTNKITKRKSILNIQFYGCDI